jgi:circadian clock protein KaiC
MTEHEFSTVDRLSTGSSALDALLGGGIPVRSVTVIAGEPGAGKTVFTLQMLFCLARQGKKCLYFTTLSEPALKKIRYMQSFSFFDAGLLDENIVFADVGSTLRRGVARDSIEHMIQRVETDRPDVVVVDSFKAFRDFLPRDPEGRTFIYDLAVTMAGWGATTFLVGEYTAEEIATLPEFVIADGILRLTHEREGLTVVRELEVFKLRGANHMTGRHFFDIDVDGFAFYPRVRGPDVQQGAPVDVADRVGTGVPDLDALVGGGLPRTSATIVEGGTGTGKTLLGLHFLLEGARHGEPAILFTLEETPAQLRAAAKGFGWDLALLESQQRLLISYTSPVELSPDRFLHQMLRQIERLAARRVVLDSLTSIALGVPSQRRFRELIYALTKHLRSLGVTVVMTMEVPELLGTVQLTGHGVSSTADNLIFLRYVEVEGRLDRAVSVLKVRGTGHSTELRRFYIDGRGAHIGGPFEDLRGVLTGVPQPWPRPRSASSRRAPLKKNTPKR